MDPSVQNSSRKWFDFERFQMGRALSAEPFVELRSFRELPFGDMVEFDSRDWFGKLLSAEGNPYNHGASVKRSVHHTTPRTPDVLRHQFTAAGEPIVIVETSQRVIVLIDKPVAPLLALPRDQWVSRINTLAHKLLAMEGVEVSRAFKREHHRWVFRYPPTLEEGAWFSTDPDAPTGDGPWSWLSRADGGITGGRLYFYLTKTRPATSGRRWVIADNKWFSQKNYL